MKSYILLAHLLLSLPAVSGDEKTPLLTNSSSGLTRSQVVDDAEEESKPDEGLRRGHSTSPAIRIRGGRTSRAIPMPHEQSHSPQLEDYFDSPPPTVGTRAEIPRRTLFEPHVKHLEDNFIRQMTFKIRVRKHTTEDSCVKITIEGFLRDKRMMKQTVDIEY